MSDQSEFRGYARVEVMGHQTHLGFVTTEAYGGVVLFRIDQPEIPEQEELLTRAERVADRIAPAGSVVRRAKIQAVTAFVGSASIYRIMPCTEAACLEAIRENLRRPFILVSTPEPAQLTAGDLQRSDEDDDEDEDPPILEMSPRQLYDAYRANFTGHNLEPWETLSYEEQSGWITFLADLKEAA